MRSRLLSLSLGAALALTAAPVLAGPTSAGPAPTPVEIGAPADLTALANTGNSATTHTGNYQAERFTATGTGPLKSITFAAITSGALTAALYTTDQFAIGSSETLPALHNTSYFTGIPLATATVPAGASGEQTASFDTAATVTAGTDYWLFLHGSLSVSLQHSSTPLYVGNNAHPVNYASRATINLDAHPVAVEPTGTEGDNGWFTGPVTATYTCWDTVTTCPATATFDTDGDHQPAGTVDNDGTDFAWFHHVKVDTTDPKITGSATRTGTGFTVTWTCSDVTSDIAECPEPTKVTGKGSDTFATGTAVDNAGNATQATIEDLYFEKIAPKLTITGVVANKTYTHGTKLTPKCIASTGINYGVRKSLSAEVTCTGTTTKHVNKDGSVKYRYLATATDTHPHGGTTTRSVSWTVAAKAKPTVIVKGLPSKNKKNGHPVIVASKSYDLSFVFRDANGTLLKGKPTWLHSVKSNKSGSKGAPWKKLNDFKKKKGAWTKSFVPGHHYKGQYRKYGVIAPDGTRYHFVVYVK